MGSPSGLPSPSYHFLIINPHLTVVDFITDSGNQGHTAPLALTDSRKVEDEREHGRHGIDLEEEGVL